MPACMDLSRSVCGHVTQDLWHLLEHVEAVHMNLRQETSDCVDDYFHYFRYLQTATTVQTKTMPKPLLLHLYHTVDCKHGTPVGTAYQTVLKQSIKSYPATHF